MTTLIVRRTKVVDEPFELTKEQIDQAKRTGEISVPPGTIFPPDITVKGKWIAHVHCDGARFHVESYSTQGTQCSEPNCILNKPTAKI